MTTKLQLKNIIIIIIIIIKIFDTHFMNKFYLNFFIMFLKYVRTKEGVIFFLKPLLKLGHRLFLQCEMYFLFCVTTTTFVSAEKNTEWDLVPEYSSWIRCK